MKVTSAAQAFIAALFLASCDRPAIDSSESLVGAQRLPSARVLSREVIQINSGFGTPGSGMLSYELRPDDTLKVSLTIRGKGADDTIAAETFHLSSKVASQARRSLWRVRPRQLTGAQYETMPAGCPPPPTDTFPETVVVFIAEGPKPGVEDDRLGIFAQPYYENCGKRRARETNNLIGRVLESFPRSKVSAEFERRAKLFKESGLQPPHPRHP